MTKRDYYIAAELLTVSSANRGVKRSLQGSPIGSPKLDEIVIELLLASLHAPLLSRRKVIKLVEASVIDRLKAVSEELDLRARRERIDDLAGTVFCLGIVLVIERLRVSFQS